MTATTGRRLRTDSVTKTFRTSAGLYVKARVEAAKRGETVNDVLNRALERYVRRGA